MSKKPRKMMRAQGSIYFVVEMTRDFESGDQGENSDGGNVLAVRYSYAKACKVAKAEDRKRGGLIAVARASVFGVV